MSLDRRTFLSTVGLAALSQFVFWSFGWNDDKYTVLTFISLVFCLILIGSFAPKGAFSRLLSQQKAVPTAAKSG